MVNIYQIVKRLMENHKLNETEISNPLPILRSIYGEMNASDSLESNIKFIINEDDLDYIIKNISISKLVSHQDSLTKEKLDNMRDLSIIKPIKVCIISGLYVLLDGNHRTYIHRERGDTSVRAMVYDLDSDNSTLARDYIKKFRRSYKIDHQSLDKKGI